MLRELRPKPYGRKRRLTKGDHRHPRTLFRHKGERSKPYPESSPAPGADAFRKLAQAPHSSPSLIGSAIRLVPRLMPRVYSSSNDRAAPLHRFAFWAFLDLAPFVGLSCSARSSLWAPRIPDMIPPQLEHDAFSLVPPDLDLHSIGAHEDNPKVFMPSIVWIDAESLI
jgi:hypothetical protein